jgi:undecaprenyl-diphosphatase
MLAAVLTSRRKSRVPRPLAELRHRRAPTRKPGVLGALGAADQWLLRQMRTRAHGEPLLTVMKGLGWAGEWAAIWTASGLTAAALDEPKRKRWLIAAATGPAAVIVNYGVKVAIGRERPLIEDHPALARAPSKLSFPSAHATSSYAAATAFGRVEPRSRVPAYGLATAIALCRPYLGMHYPSDVLAGAVLGTLIGGFVPGVGERTLEERMIDFVAARAGEVAPIVEEPEAAP